MRTSWSDPNSAFLITPILDNFGGWEQQVHSNTDWEASEFDLYPSSIMEFKNWVEKDEHGLGTDFDSHRIHACLNQFQKKSSKAAKGGGGNGERGHITL